jgi:GT2 family glycosyltransferase
MAKPIDVVIVNWNSGEQLRACLASLESACRAISLGKVVVVDNGSTDGSADGLEGFQPPLLVLHNNANRGFAAACNQGAAISQAPYILFLNPDTRLEPNSLLAPFTFMEDAAHQRVGICGIQLVDDRGRTTRSCSRLPTPRRLVSRALGLHHLLPGWFPSQFMTEWDHSSTRVVDQVMGAFFLVRRQVFHELGGFDTRFFVYFEEVDFTVRALQAGWLTAYLATARAYHRGGGASRQVKAARLFYSLQSRILYGLKHFSLAEAGAVTALTVLVEPLCRVGHAAVRCARQELCDTLRAYLMLWRHLAKILSLARSLERR